MKRTAGEIASFLSAQLEGDGKVMVTGVSAPETAKPEDLIYVEAERFVKAATRSQARTVITSPLFRIAGKTMILAPQPKLAFARAAAWLMPAPQIACGIHPTAVVDPATKVASNAGIGPYAVVEAGAQIGANSQIGSHCFIGAGAVVGEACRLHPRVTLYAGARLGNRVVIHSGAVIGSNGFGFVFGEGRFWPFPQVGQVHIEDDVEIGANSTVDRGSLGETILAQGTKLDNLVHIAHNVRVGEHTVIAAQTGISGSSTLGKNVLVGGQVGIGDHCEIEDGAVLGGQAGILSGKTIRARQTVWGTPARPLEKFKELYACFSRLPGLTERVRRLEQEK